MSATEGHQDRHVRLLWFDKPYRWTHLIDQLDGSSPCINSKFDVILPGLAEVPGIDFTAARALEDIIIDTSTADRAIFLIGDGKNVFKMLVQRDVIRHIDPCHINEYCLDALLHARQQLNQ